MGEAMPLFYVKRHDNPKPDRTEWRQRIERRRRHGMEVKISR